MKREKMKFRASVRLFNKDGKQFGLQEEIGTKEECRKYVGLIHMMCKRMPWYFGHTEYSTVASFTWEVIEWQSPRIPGQRVIL